MYFCNRVYRNFLFLIVLSFLFAKLEIHIEGDQGWATALPTWKKNCIGFVLTGYHFYLWSFLIFVFHVPLLFMKWSWSIEFFILSFLFSFFLLEDAFWFWFHHDFKDKKDHWRDPKLFGTIPYFFFIAGMIAVYAAWKTRCKIWAKLITMLLLVILISYPFQTCGDLCSETTCL